MKKMILKMYGRSKAALRPAFFRLKRKYDRLRMGPDGPKKEFTLNRNIRWIGTDYGGFFVDVSLLSGKSVVLSFGVGTDISFDQGVADFGVREIFLFDPTPVAKDFLQRLNLSRRYKYFSYGLSDKDETREFFLPTKEGCISGSMIYHGDLGRGERILVQFRSLSSICKELGIAAIDVLKMDIEGSEFAVIKNIFSDKIFPRQICIEFHSRFFENGKALLDESLKLLHESGYVLAGKSTDEEFLFIRKN
jgi:FkbM family methyltransferase